MSVANRVQIGVRFEPDWAPEDLPAFARQIEAWGYDEIWFSEDLPWAGGIAMAATALAHTDHLNVGIGLIPAPTRNVATLAMEISTLARIAPGRLTVALGRGLPAWMRQVGAEPNDPGTVLQQTATVLRSLLNGDTVTIASSAVNLHEVTLGYPAADVPEVLMGTTGPRGLRMAASCSDGVVFPEISAPEAVQWAREQMRNGERRSVVVFAMVSVDDDPMRAMEQTRRKIERVVNFGAFPRLTELAGLGTDGGGTMTEDILQKMAATGTPADCLLATRRWAAAGADRIVLVAGDEDPRASYGRYATEVLPLLTE